MPQLVDMEAEEGDSDEDLDEVSQEWDEDDEEDSDEEELVAAQRKSTVSRCFSFLFVFFDRRSMASAWASEKGPS